MKKLISSVVVASAVMGGNVYAQTPPDGPIAGTNNNLVLEEGNLVVTADVLTVTSTTTTKTLKFQNDKTIVSGVKPSTDGSGNNALLTTQGYVDQQVGGVQNQVTNLNTRVDGLQNRIGEVERNSYAGIAGVAAISQIQVAPGKDFAIGVGVGTYRGQSTAAIGAAARINENLHFRAGFSGSGVAAAGLTFSW